jgi:hypothetical protein
MCWQIFSESESNERLPTIAQRKALLMVTSGVMDQLISLAKPSMVKISLSRAVDANLSTAGIPKD